MDWRIIWIDNSPEASGATRYGKYFELRQKYLPIRENIGYTKAINAGLALSTAPYVVLMNSDTEVQTEGWLEKLADVFNSQETAWTGWGNASGLGMVGPATDRPQQGLAGTLPKNSGPHVVTPAPTPHGILDVKLWFWCIMLRREAILDVGYLDERFSPGGGEDDDWLIRAYSRGWKAAIQTDVTVSHVGQVSWPALEPLEVRSERAHRLLREKYRPADCVICHAPSVGQLDGSFRCKEHRT
jgi:GT2 family glycosyltransferase